MAEAKRIVSVTLVAADLSGRTVEHLLADDSTKSIVLPSAEDASGYKDIIDAAIVASGL